jgi:hypothetical protein
VAVLLAVVQDLGGGHHRNQDLTSAGDPGGPGVGGGLDHLELGVEVGEAPLSLLPLPTALAKPASQLRDLASMP